MKYLKIISLAALAAMALMAVAAGSASATTLEVGGVTTNASVTIKASLATGTSTILRDTNNSTIDTCTTSTFEGKTESSFTGATIGGKLTGLTFGNCTHTTTVDAKGSLTVEHVAGTTNGTVRSTGMSVTWQSTTFGATLNCQTNNTHLGTLTGSASGHASLKVNAVVNCGFFVPSMKWEATYTFTTPTGLGVVA
jgi:hypothetical protein